MLNNCFAFVSVQAKTTNKDQ